MHRRFFVPRFRMKSAGWGAVPGQIPAAGFKRWLESRFATAATRLVCVRKELPRMLTRTQGVY